MIKIADKPLDPQTQENEYSNNSLEWSIIETMSNSPEIYDYDSLNQFKFEVEMRNATVNAAKELGSVKFDFATFRHSKCNSAYWDRTDDGGFLLKSGVKPSVAIRDIFENAYEYATECATAIMIVFYKATLDMFNDTLFDQVFPEIYLMNWQHVDPIFRSIGLMQNVKDYLPGDRRYFVNPDVNPETPEWRGENVIMLDINSFYGHGIGIHDEETIVNELNQNRANGAEDSAYLEKQASRPNYRDLSEIKQKSNN